MSNLIVSFDKQTVKGKMRKLVRRTIEETINATLDEEADQMVGAGPYERTDERAAYRAGYYERGFTTTPDQVTLKSPSSRECASRPRSSSATRGMRPAWRRPIIEMRLAGAFTRRVEDVSEILWGAGISADTVSNLNEKAFKPADERRCRPLTCAYPYIKIDGIYLKRSWGGSYENVAVMAVTRVNEDGCREVIGCAEGFTEPSECWRDFLSWLKSRGLRGVRMIVGDKAAGMVGSIAEVFPKAKTSAARCISTATSSPRFPNPSAPRPRPCSRPSKRWSRARRRPPKSYATGVPRRWRTAICRASIGGAPARTTQSSGSTGRHAAAPTRSARSPTRNLRSCRWPPS